MLGCEMWLPRRQCGALCLGAALLVPTRAAQAAPPLQVELTYQVDPTLTDCPSAAELARTITAQLGHDPFVTAPTPARHRLKASIQRAGAGTEAHVEWLDQQGGSEGERRLGSEHPECAEIARGLSFAIAVQI